MPGEISLAHSGVRGIIVKAVENCDVTRSIVITGKTNLDPPIGLSGRLNDDALSSNEGIKVEKRHNHSAST